MKKASPSGRIVIIGAGNVGSAIAFSLINKDIAQKIIMLDTNTSLLNSQILDLQDSTNFSDSVEIYSGDYADLIDGDMVVLACGVSQKREQSRSELLKENLVTVRSVISNIRHTGKQVYICVVTNPVDPLTYFAIKEANLPQGMVFGSGTLLDTSRLKICLRDMLDISHKNIHAYIMGEHGDSSFAVLSSADVGGIPMNMLMDIENVRDEIQSNVRDKAYEIIDGKGATYYGIGSAVAELCSYIINDEKRIATLSYLLEGQYGIYDVVLSAPVKVSSNGVEALQELEMNSVEIELMKESAKRIKEEISNNTK